LCCGQCQDIWKYVIQNIKSKEKVKNIKENLEWYPSCCCLSVVIEDSVLVVTAPL
ncbi:hypothetical protein scyTo_0023963, partial [Scyliorhinus torazame]|nr:hypothetical protein [Scyliorhinus torazame]